MLLLLLSRQQIWTDKKTMEELLKLDPIIKDFYEVFKKLREGVFQMSIDELKLFNEVLYQATRIVNEHPDFKGVRFYLDEIKKDLPQWDYSGELTMTMVHFLLRLRSKDERRMTEEVTKEMSHFLGDSYSNPFLTPFWLEFRRLQKNGKRVTYPFNPCPNEDAQQLSSDESAASGAAQQEETSVGPPEILVEKDNSESIIQNNIVIKRIKDNQSIDLVQLHKIIDEFFVKKIQNRYDWFALWRVLSDADLLSDTTMTKFERQMVEWYPLTPKPCSADSIGDYYKGYLGSHRFEEWNPQDFETHKRDKQSKRGYEQIRSLCFELRTELSRGKFLH